MITVEKVLIIHDLLIERFGGNSGVRDRGLLESAVNRPLQTFDTEDLYATLVEKGAAIMESIVRNHPFVDGNKRTGYTLMRLFLLHYDCDIDASENEKYDFVISIAGGKISFNTIKDWLEKKG